MLLNANERIEKLTDLITLNAIEGIGPNRMYALIDRFGSAGAVLAKSKADLLDIPGIGESLANTIVNGQNRRAADDVVKTIIKLGSMTTDIPSLWRHFPTNLPACSISVNISRRTRTRLPLSVRGWHPKRVACLPGSCPWRWPNAE